MSELALLGGKKAKNKAFPLWPYYDNKEVQVLKEVLESRVWWRTPGTKTLEFEQAFAQFHGARHGVAVTNGTAALEVTMAAVGITAGDEVIVPPYTFVATVNAVMMNYALPVFVDSDPETFQMDARKLDAAHVVIAALHALAQRGDVKADVVAAAIDRYGIDAEAVDPRDA